jgi:hypothetical protein
MPRGLVDFFFWEGPSNAGCFPATFLVMWGLASFAPLHCYQSPSIGAANGSPRHPHRLTNHWWAHQRCIPLPSPSHGSCKDQTQCYECKLATIRHGVKLQMILHIPMAKAKSICMPSSRLAIGGIPPSQIAVPVTYLSPHLGASPVTLRSCRRARSTHTSDAPYPYKAAPA